MAVPGNLDSKNSAGCWKLIREGAVMVTCVKDAVAAVGSEPVPKHKTPPVPDKASAKKASEVPYGKPPQASDSTVRTAQPRMSLEEAAILKAVPSTGITLERLAFATKLPAPNVADAAMSLRLKKLIRFLPGNRIAPISDGCI